MHPNAKNMYGKVFGRLTVGLLAGVARDRVLVWNCVCACGSAVIVRGADLRNGKTLSCGCLGKEMRRAAAMDHGDAQRQKTAREYAIWASMVQRCTNPRSAGWKRYGGRGITVCAAWRNDYASFAADMGRRPSSRHSIDRIDNDGNYEPGNCRWATPREQRMNQERMKRCEAAA